MQTQVRGRNLWNGGKHEQEGIDLFPRLPEDPSSSSSSSPTLLPQHYRRGKVVMSSVPGARTLVGGHKVSIVLPVYNSSAEVLPTLAELERQTYPDKEIIVVDD